jgi:hypothetical protein
MLPRLLPQLGRCDHRPSVPIDFLVNESRDLFRLRLFKLSGLLDSGY